MSCPSATAIDRGVRCSYRVWQRCARMREHGKRGERSVNAIAQRAEVARATNEKLEDSGLARWPLPFRRDFSTEPKPWCAPAPIVIAGHGAEMAARGAVASRWPGVDFVMPALVAGIHVFGATEGKKVNGRAFASPKRLRPRRLVKPGHDDISRKNSPDNAAQREAAAFPSLAFSSACSRARRNAFSRSLLA